MSKDKLIISGYISPTSEQDEYATHIDIYGKGGVHSVTSITNMHDISQNRRSEGMLVYVQAEKTLYQLTGGTKNDSWVQLFKLGDKGIEHINLQVAEDGESLDSDNGIKIDPRLLRDIQLDLIQNEKEIRDLETRVYANNQGSGSRRLQESPLFEVIGTENQIEVADNNQITLSSELKVPGNLEVSNGDLIIPVGATEERPEYPKIGMIRLNTDLETPNVSGGPLIIPIGTTDERPAEQSLGSIRYNTEEQNLEIWNSNDWQSLHGSFSNMQDINTNNLRFNYSAPSTSMYNINHYLDESTSSYPVYMRERYGVAGANGYRGWTVEYMPGTENYAGHGSYRILYYHPLQSKELFKIASLGSSWYIYSYASMRMNNNKIVDLASPTLNGDAANKEYVDSLVRDAASPSMLQGYLKYTLELSGSLNLIPFSHVKYSYGNDIVLNPSGSISLKGGNLYKLTGCLGHLTITTVELRAKWYDYTKNQYIGSGAFVFPHNRDNITVNDNQTAIAYLEAVDDTEVGLRVHYGSAAYIQGEETRGGSSWFIVEKISSISHFTARTFLANEEINSLIIPESNFKICKIRMLGGGGGQGIYGTNGSSGAGGFTVYHFDTTNYIGKELKCITGSGGYGGAYQLSGSTASKGGFPNGGYGISGDVYPGGGGGRSDIRIGEVGEAFSSCTILAIAGGGGGGTGYSVYGGAGGGITGQASGHSTSTAGTQKSGGTSASNPPSSFVQAGYLRGAGGSYLLSGQSYDTGGGGDGYYGGGCSGGDAKASSGGSGYINSHFNGFIANYQGVNSATYQGNQTSIPDVAKLDEDFDNGFGVGRSGISRSGPLYGLSGGDGKIIVEFL